MHVVLQATTVTLTFEISKAWLLMPMSRGEIEEFHYFFSTTTPNFCFLPWRIVVWKLTTSTGLCADGGLHWYTTRIAEKLMQFYFSVMGAWLDLAAVDS